VIYVIYVICVIYVIYVIDGVSGAQLNGGVEGAGGDLCAHSPLHV
jgi:hypothetical protein